MRLLRLLCVLLVACVPASARLSGISSAPATILSITANPPTGTLTAIGASETFTVCYGVAVTISGGPPTLPINTSTASSTATYASGSGTKCHVYNYTVALNAAANPVATTSSGILANGATFIDANGYTPNQSGAVNVSFPGLAFAPGSTGGPTITSITSSCSGTVSTPGTKCVYSLHLSAPGFIGGSWHPILNLATSPAASMAFLCDDVDANRTLASYAQQCSGVGSGNGTNVLNFGHTVWGGQIASPVVTSASGINLNGATIQNSGGTGFNLNGANSVTVNPSGGFSVSGGNLVGPSGNIKKLQGIAVSDTDTSFYGAPLAAKLRSLFPNINLVRLSVAPQGSGPYTWATPASLAPFVNAMTALGAIVVIENHDDNVSLYTGSTLTGESAWYASLGTYFIGNPYVMYQTMNEPAANDSPQMQATYNALRGIGYAGVIFVEAGQGAAGTPVPSPGPYSTSSVGSLTWFASATNIAWDIHFYNWQSNNSTSVPTIQSDQNSRISAFHAVSTVSGVMPVITLETGVSTSGSSLDAGGSQEITASFTNANLQGASAWALDIYQGLNVLTNASANSSVPVGSITLTSPYGTEVAGYTPSSSGPLFGAGTGLSYAPGNGYFVAASGGSDSNSGLSPAASFATLTKCQTAMHSGSIKTCWLSGTFSGLGTCNFTSNNGTGGLTAFICLSGTNDNNETWARLPGGTAVINGGASNDSTGTNAAFEACGGVTTGACSGFGSVTGLTFQGIHFQNFNFANLYIFQPVSYTAIDNIFDTIYNDCQSDSPAYRNIGCGAGSSIFNWWTDVNVSHNLIEHTNAQGIVTNSGESGLNGYSMTLTYDANLGIDCANTTFDTGCIYGGWFPFNNLNGIALGTLNITGNLVSITGTPNNNQPGIYLDDIASGFKVTGNIVNGTGLQYCTEINAGGANNLIANNICDLTAVAQYGTGSSGNQNTTAFYAPSPDQHGGPPLTQTNVVYTGNTVYSGSTTFPPPIFMGLSEVTNGQPGTPTLETNWYYTAHGVFNSLCWAIGTLSSGSSGICDTMGVIITTNPFVNPSALTAAGYQYAPGSPQLAGGIPQPAQNQGPRY